MNETQRMLCDINRSRILARAVRLLALATECRQNNLLFNDGGFVLIHEKGNGTLVAMGWCAVTGGAPAANPAGHCPGNLAISEGGRVFVAAGGDSYSGAQCWEFVGVVS